MGTNNNSASFDDERPQVILADDQQVVLDTIKRLLEPEFVVIGTARDGLELLEAAGTLNPDVLVVDISMPRMSGIEAARELHGHRIVFLSILRNQSVIEEAFTAGALGYVLKPNAADQLPLAIRAALEGRKYTCSELRR
jgi:DNA-binding NarL/FixJ family response regulator